MIDVESRLHCRGDYLWGSFIRSAEVDGYIQATNPGDRSDPLGRFAFASSAVDEAVGAAREGFAAWSGLSLDVRAEALRRLAGRIEEAADDLAKLISRETGRALWEARAEVTASARAARLVAEEAAGRLADGVVREGVAGFTLRPLGVVAVVTAFTWPLHGPVLQVASALLGGNTVVFKPSKFAPATGQALAELIDRIRLPRGAFNLVQGTGAVVGSRLVGHPGVDGILFTGRRETAARVRALAAARPEVPVHVQCATKGAAILLPDADLDLAVHEIAVSAWANAGQRHDACARVFVTADRFDVFCEKLAARARAIRWGYGLDPGVFLGPMISDAARRAYRASLQDLADRACPTIVSGGPVELDGRRGAYVRPSVTWITRPEGLDAEIPGPAIRVWVVRDVEEAVSLHDQLASRPSTSLFTTSESAAKALLPRLSSGAVLVNRGPSPLSIRLPVVGRGTASSGFPAPLELAAALCVPQPWMFDRRPYDASRLIPGAGPLPAIQGGADPSITLDG